MRSGAAPCSLILLKLPPSPQYRYAHQQDAVSFLTLSSLSLTFVRFRHLDLSLQRLGRAAQRPPLSIVGPEKHAVDSDAPLFELGLHGAVVIVPVIRQNVVLGIDGKAVDGQSLDIFQAHSDQVPVFDLFGQAVDKGFFADDGEPAARYGKHAIQMQHAFYKPNAFHRILIA